MAGGRAELGEFLTVGVGLAFGAFGPCTQVGAQLVTFADGVGAEAGQHRVRVGADPARRGPGCVLGGLRAGGVLLGQPGRPVRRGGLGLGLVPVGLGGADPAGRRRRGPARSRWRWRILRRRSVRGARAA